MPDPLQKQKEVTFSTNILERSSINEEDTIHSPSENVKNQEVDDVESSNTEKKSFSRRNSLQTKPNLPTLTMVRKRKRALTIDTTPSISMSTHVPTHNRHEKKSFEYGGFEINCDGILKYPEHLEPYLNSYLKNTGKRKKLSKSKSRVEEFKSLKVIGEGRSSRVSLVKDIQTGGLYARKTIFLSNDIPNFIVSRELSALMLCYECANIVQFVDAFYDGFCLHLITNYVDGISLDTIPIVEEEVAISILYQAIHGIYCLHTRRILHMDIKLGNMMLTPKGYLYIYDFGLSLYLPQDQEYFEAKLSSDGSLSYMAPEKIQNLEFGFSSDIWSLGITGLHLISGYVPETHADKYYQSMENILSVPNELPRIIGDRKMSSKFLDFLKQCLQLEDKKRPSASELLNHELFQDLDMKRSAKRLKQFYNELQKPKTH